MCVQHFSYILKLMSNDNWAKLLNETLIFPSMSPKTFYTWTMVQKLHCRRLALAYSVKTAHMLVPQEIDEKSVWFFLCYGTYITYHCMLFHHLPAQNQFCMCSGGTLARSHRCACILHCCCHTHWCLSKWGREIFHFNYRNTRWLEVIQNGGASGSLVDICLGENTTPETQPNRLTIACSAIAVQGVTTGATAREWPQDIGTCLLAVVSSCSALIVV